MSITIKTAKNEHSQYILTANKAFEDDDYEKALSLISCVANQAYHLNYCYTDRDLENLLLKISNKLIQKNGNFPSKNRYVFYDDFGYDNRGLTQQYLNSLDQMDVEYLYLIDSEDFSDDSEIAEQINKNDKAVIVKVPQSLTKIEKILFIYRIVSEYNPEKSFLHIKPWSTVAVVLWNAFPNVEKYLIDLTDHAFWLGVSCCDYFIGFRDYGYNISRHQRGIEAGKLLHLPYYPVVSSSDFRGFPESVNSRVKIFSGATFYKIYGENDIFFQILKKIVLDNPNVAILFAGSGDARPLERFIKKNNLNNNILLIGNRSDINEVFKNCDIYLNTYPIFGALMSQYAVLNNKPLIGYTSPDVPFNESAGLFVKSPHYMTTYCDLIEFHDAINILISSFDARKSSSAYPEGILHTPESFASEFSKLIKEKKPAILKEMEIDIARFSDIYLSMENNYLHKYHAIKFRHLGLNSFVYFPLKSIVSIINVLRYNFGFIVKYLKGI
jgi:glycosyltransferase involved in cell wall biosynthesis